MSIQLMNKPKKSIQQMNKPQMKMLGIIVCDDDRFMMETSAKLVQQCIKDNAYPAAVVCAATDFKIVMRYIKKNPGAYLYFLDIDFGKAALNGIDIAKIIKKAEPLSKIVFVTSYADMGIGVLKSGAEAFGFVEKTDAPGKMLLDFKKYIRLALDLAPAAAKSEEGERRIKLLVGIDEYIYLPVSQILYVEAEKTVSHFICYHTVDGSSVSVRDSIENALQNLGAGFMRSHRSVIVNKSNVVSAGDGLVKFAGGETAACSFRLKNAIINECGLIKG